MERPNRLRVLTVLGTRPEALKLAPVIRELARHPNRIDSAVCATGQHRELLDQTLEIFGLRPQVNLHLMTENQTPTQMAAQALQRLDAVLKRYAPDLLLIQGDTTTTAAAALSAYHQRIPIGHVEAGLRTGDKWHPFPEEVNRRIVGMVADLHFAPTEGAKRNLLREGVEENAVWVTGNTVIDTLRWALEIPYDPSGGPLAAIPLAGKILVVTTHRRESFGEPLTAVWRALARIARRYAGEVRIVFPVHPNPAVRTRVEPVLGGLPNVHLVAPLDYLSFVHLMRRSFAILTDSGGLQEEAPELHKPLLILRERSERPEAVEAGAARIVGTDEDAIVEAAGELLENGETYLRMAAAPNPFGDGHAAERIVGLLLERRGA